MLLVQSRRPRCFFGMASILAKIKKPYRCNNSYVVPFAFPFANLTNYRTPLWYSYPVNGGTLGILPQTGNDWTPKSISSITIENPLGQVQIYTGAAPMGPPPATAIVNACILQSFAQVANDVQQMFSTQYGNWYTAHPKDFYERCASIYSNYNFNGAVTAEFPNAQSVGGGTYTLAVTSDEPVTIYAARSEASFRCFLTISPNTAQSSDFTANFSTNVAVDKCNTSAAIHDATALVTGSSVGQNAANQSKPVDHLARVAHDSDTSIDEPPKVALNSKAKVSVIDKLHKCGITPCPEDATPGSNVVVSKLPSSLQSLHATASNVSKGIKMDPNAPAWRGAAKTAARDVGKGVVNLSAKYL